MLPLQKKNSGLALGAYLSFHIVFFFFTCNNYMVQGRFGNLINKKKVTGTFVVNVNKGVFGWEVW